jgi:hypothetical protein
MLDSTGLKTFLLFGIISVTDTFIRMSSDRRIRASRANGAKSAGPKTPEGKRRSANNGIRHGILAQTVVFDDDEDRDAFVAKLASYEAEFEPDTESRADLVETLTIARWRLMRIWGIEKAGLCLEIAKHDPALYDPATRDAMAFKTLSDDSRSLDVLHRYETRYDRQYARAYRLLKSKWNLPNEPSPISGHPPAPPSGLPTPGSPCIPYSS